jgi:hypothetical protein
MAAATTTAVTARTELGRSVHNHAMPLDRVSRPGDLVWTGRPYRAEDYVPDASTMGGFAA